MHITKAIQNGKIVEMFDEKGNKVFEKEGELFEVNSPTLRIKTSEDTIDAIWAEGKEIREQTEHIVNVEFEYKVLRFVQGATFKRWIDMNKLDLNEIRKHGEIVQ